MVPASVTATATLSAAGEVVSEFGPLVLLVGGIIVGIWAVRFIMRSVRKSVRG